MDGFHTQCVKALGASPLVYWGSFAPNGASDPLLASSRYPRGLAFTVAYSATGVYTVTLPSGLALPAQPSAIVLGVQVDALASYFEAMIVGDTTLNAAARQFVIQAHRSGTGRQVAAATGTRINFMIGAQNSGGL